MKYYVQYQRTMTTRFDSMACAFGICEPYQYDAIGSDAVMILDGRISLDNMIYIAERNMPKRLKKNYTSFKIVKAETFSEKGKVLFTSVTTVKQITNGLQS